MSRGPGWGTPRIFAVTDDEAPGRFRLRVDGGPFGPVLASLALAAAQARAAVLEGHRVEITSIDGTAAEVEHQDGRFVVRSWSSADWPARCARLLVEHG